MADEMTDSELVNEFKFAVRSGASGAEAHLETMLLRRLSAGNPQAEKVDKIVKMHCDKCAKGCPDSPGCSNSKCACRLSNLRQLAQLLRDSGAIMTLTLDGAQWRELLASRDAEIAARDAEIARLRIELEPERSDERVEEIKCTKCGQLVLLSQRLLIEWPAEVKCAQDSAPCDGEVRLIPYCERHDPRNGSR